MGTLFKAIFLDVDNTIYDTENKHFNYDDVEILRQIKRNDSTKDIRMIVVTDRNWASAKKIGLFEEMPFIDCFASSSTGAIRYFNKSKDEGPDIDGDPIDADTLKQCEEIIDDQGKYCVSSYITNSGNYLNGQENDAFRRYRETWNDHSHTSEDRPSTDEVYAIMVFIDGETGTIEKELESKLSGLNLKLKRFAYNGITYSYSIVKGAKEDRYDKGALFKKVLEKYKIDASKTIAFGDSESDYTLLCEAHDSYLIRKDASSEGIPEEVCKWVNITDKSVAEILMDKKLSTERLSLDKFEQFTDESEFRKSLEVLGIVDCLPENDFERFNFKENFFTKGVKVSYMGIMGYNKVKDEDEDKEYNSPLLLKLRDSTATSGPVLRCLLLNPCCKEFKRQIDLIKDFDMLDNYVKAYEKWFILKRKTGDKLDLRFYDNKPAGFIKIFDNRYFSLTEYSTNSDKTDSLKKKEKSLIITGENTNPHLKIAVENMYNYRFKRAKKYNYLFEKVAMLMVKNIVNGRKRKLNALFACYVNNDKGIIDFATEVFKASTGNLRIAHYKEKEGERSRNWKEYDKKFLKMAGSVMFVIPERLFPTKDKDDKWKCADEAIYLCDELVFIYRYAKNKPIYFITDYKGNGNDFADRISEFAKCGHAKSSVKEDRETVAKHFENIIKRGDNCIVQVKANENEKVDGKICFDGDSFKETLKGIYQQISKEEYVERPVEEMSEETQDNNSFIENIKEIGVYNCKPIGKRCMGLVNKAYKGNDGNLFLTTITSYYFSGAYDLDVKERFKQILEEAKKYKNPVKVLLLSPKSDYFNNILKTAYESKETALKRLTQHYKAYRSWIELSKEYSGSLEVKCYDDDPTFDIVLFGPTSKEGMLLSPYDIDTGKQGAGANKRSITNPYLMIKHLENSADKSSLINLFKEEYNFRFENTKKRILSFENYVEKNLKTEIKDTLKNNYKCSEEEIDKEMA